MGAFLFKIYIMELIKITEKNGEKAVSAKELYDFLGYNKAHWAKWYRKNIEENDFAIESIDFQTFTLSANGNETKDFALSIDFAKKISMMARTEKGEIARNYFIECEKVAKNGIPKVSRLEFAKMLVEAEENNEKLMLELKKNEPKVLFANAVVGSASSCLIGELAKIICQNGFEIGQNRLFEWLRSEGYLGKFGERKNIPNQKYIEMGLFELKKGVRSGNDGVMRHTITTKVTGKGQVFFVNKFLNDSEENALFQ